MLVLVGKYVPKTILFSTLSLSETIQNNSSQNDLIGLVGITINDLRPSGTAKFNNKKLDVVTTGDFLSKNTKVEIISVSGSRITVRKI